MAAKKSGKRATRSRPKSSAKKAAKAAPKRAAKKAAATIAPSVDAYMSDLKHAHKDGVQDIRRLILSLAGGIKEDVKWNAPSFYSDDHFATFRLHPSPIFQLILHTGAKKKASAKPLKIDDPKGLLKWAAADRCVVTFSSAADAKAKKGALTAILRAWISQL